MKSNRRNFLKYSGLSGVVMAGEKMIRPFIDETSIAQPDHLFQDKHFNMCGYAAPKLETVRIGFIGLGNRGPAAVIRTSKIEGVDIKALCDLRPEKANGAKKKLQDATKAFNPEVYTGSENEWKKLCERKDIDLVYIATPWHLHAPMAVYAMKQGKHVAVEVPAAVTVDECWEMVETSEKTRKHCMILENCCYDFFELLTLNMARQGLLGEIVHCEGAYIHDLLKSNFSKTTYHDMWRLKENMRNGNLYPTHGLGPVAQVLNINRGDKMDYLVAMSTNDFMMAPMAKELAGKDDFYKQFAGKSFRGNMNTTTIKTSKGRTIMLQHDVSSPNVYSRIHKVSGTKGSALKYPLPGKIAIGHEDWMTAEELKATEEKYMPPIVRKVGEMAKQVGGHGGMDFFVLHAFFESVKRKVNTPMDVYDAAAWSAITPLSETSIELGNQTVDFPDFTGGQWMYKKSIFALNDEY